MNGKQLAVASMCVGLVFILSLYHFAFKAYFKEAQSKIIIFSDNEAFHNHRKLSQRIFPANRIEFCDMPTIIKATIKT